MSKHADGEFVGLWWEDFATELHVYGHVTNDVFTSAVAAEHDGPGLVVPVPGIPEHRWGAWRLDGVDEYGNARRILRTYTERGRGMFPVTTADVVRWEVAPDTRPEPDNEWDRASRIEGVARNAAIAESRNRWIGAVAAMEEG